MEIKKDHTTATKIKVLLSPYEAFILQSILKDDKKHDGHFRKIMLFLLDLHLEELRGAKKNG